MFNLITTDRAKNKYGDYVLRIGNEFANTTYTTVQSMAEKFTQEEVNEILSKNKNLKISQ